MAQTANCWSLTLRLHLYTPLSYRRRMLLSSNQRVSEVMLNQMDRNMALMGCEFSVGERQYAVVDVRRVNGETMVYADPLQSGLEGGRQGPIRAAFRMHDLADRLPPEIQR